MSKRTQDRPEIPTPTLTRAARLAVAGFAMTDPRTVDRYCDGQPVRGLSRTRIEAAIQEIGLERLSHKPQAAAVAADAA